DLMLLGTPINPYKPLVWHRLISSLGRHSSRYSKTHNSLSSLSRVLLSLMISRGCHSALYGCLMHNFLPEVSHGSLARVHVLCWHSGCRALGVLRARGSPRSNSIVLHLDSSLMVQGSCRCHGYRPRRGRRRDRRRAYDAPASRGAYRLFHAAGPTNAC